MFAHSSWFCNEAGDHSHSGEGEKVKHQLDVKAPSTRRANTALGRWHKKAKSDKLIVRRRNKNNL